MASLVTLSAAPYNPYNTSFANIALEGLRMAQQEMARRDANSQRSMDNYMRSVQFGADVLFKQQEMALNRKKFDFSVDQALFERKMQAEEQQFRKEQLSEGIRQFNVSSGFKEQEIGLRRDEGNFRERVYEEGAPAREAATEGQWLQNTINLDTLQERQRTAPLRELGQRVQIGTQLANAQSNLINAETNATNAENRAKYYDTVNKDRMAQVRAVNGRIDDTRKAIYKAYQDLARAKRDRKGFNKDKTSPEEIQIQSNIEKLNRDLETLNGQLYQINGDNPQGGVNLPRTTPVDRFLDGSMGRPNPLLPSISPTPELD